MAKSGLVIGVNVSRENGVGKGGTVVVLRKAFSNKDVKPLFARFLSSLPSTGTKVEAKVINGHKLVTGKRGVGTFAWWVEESKKEDLVLVLSSPGAEVAVLDALDGKTPSVLTSPLRTELASPRDGFERTGMALMDFDTITKADPRTNAAQFQAASGLTRVDFVMGFGGEALETVSRIHSSKPAMATQFDKATIPSIPSGVLGLVVLAADFKGLPGTLFAAPTVRPLYEQAVATLKQKAKLRLEEDLLAHLGPKLTAYTLPGKSGGAGTSVLPNMVAMIAQGGAGGADSLPKMAILIDVANQTAFSKSLDELMGYVNRELKTAFAPPRGPGGEAPPPPPGGSRRGGPPAGPAPEFRVMAGETKSYVLNVPPELSSVIPAGLRPTIRLGPKQVAIAASADVARQALDAKGNYTPPSEIAAAFGRLPSKLNWLMVVDPRNSTPEILAALPAKLQAGLNTIILPSAPAPATATPPTGGPAAGSPPAAGQFVLQVDPGKLPSADETRKLLFPAMFTIDQDGDAVRISSRAAFPLIPDPVLVGFVVRSVQLQMNPNAANPGGATPPRGAPDGVTDAPARPGGTAPGGSKLGQPGMRGVGGPARVQP